MKQRFYQACEKIGKIQECTCGSGGHPRKCKKHPWGFRMHVFEMNQDNLYDSLEELEKKMKECNYCDCKNRCNCNDEIKSTVCPQHNNILISDKEIIKELLEFINTIDSGFDCDDDAHKYHTLCRCCGARKLYLKYKDKLNET